MKKISTMRTSGKNIFEGRLTIGLDLGDRSSAYRVLNEAEEIVLEHKLATTPEAMMQVFRGMRPPGDRYTLFLNAGFIRPKQRSKGSAQDAPDLEIS